MHKHLRDFFQLKLICMKGTVQDLCIISFTNVPFSLYKLLHSFTISLGYETCCLVFHIGISIIGHMSVFSSYWRWFVIGFLFLLIKLDQFINSKQLFWLIPTRFLIQVHIVLNKDKFPFSWYFEKVTHRKKLIVIKKRES